MQRNVLPARSRYLPSLRRQTQLHMSTASQHPAQSRRAQSSRPRPCSFLHMYLTADMRSSLMPRVPLCHPPFPILTFRSPCPSTLLARLNVLSAVLVCGRAVRAAVRYGTLHTAAADDAAFILYSKVRQMRSLSDWEKVTGGRLASGPCVRPVIGQLHQYLPKC